MRIRPGIGAAVVFELGALVIALVLAAVVGVDLLSQIRFRWQGILWSIVAILPLLIAMWGIVHTPWAPFTRILRELDETVIPLFASCSFQELALISFLAGLGEEALFRGLVQTQLSSAFGVWAGLTGASVLFGLVHLLTPAYGILAGLVGAYLGFLFMLSENLLVPITTHAFYDLIALVYLVRRSLLEKSMTKL